MIRDVNTEQLLEYVTSDKRVCIKFYAEWCGACKEFKQEYESWSRMNPLTFFLSVDSDSNRDAVSKYRVRYLPTVIVQQGDNQIKLEETTYEMFRKAMRSLDGFTS